MPTIKWYKYSLHPKLTKIHLVTAGTNINSLALLPKIWYTYFQFCGCESVLGEVMLRYKLNEVVLALSYADFFSKETAKWNRNNCAVLINDSEKEEFSSKGRTELVLSWYKFGKPPWLWKNIVPQKSCIIINKYYFCLVWRMTILPFIIQSNFCASEKVQK